MTTVKSARACSEIATSAPRTTTSPADFQNDANVRSAPAAIARSVRADGKSEAASSRGSFMYSREKAGGRGRGVEGARLAPVASRRVSLRSSFPGGTPKELRFDVQVALTTLKTRTT